MDKAPRRRRQCNLGLIQVANVQGRLSRAATRTVLVLGWGIDKSAGVGCLLVQ